MNPAKQTDIATKPAETKIELEMEALRIAAQSHRGQIVGVRLISRGHYEVDQHDTSGKVLRHNIAQIYPERRPAII